MEVFIGAFCLSLVLVYLFLSIRKIIRFMQKQDEEAKQFDEYVQSEDFIKAEKRSSSIKED